MKKWQAALRQALKKRHEYFEQKRLSRFKCRGHKQAIGSPSRQCRNTGHKQTEVLKIPDKHEGGVNK